MAIGKCPKCPAGSRDVLLIGGECYEHFKKVSNVVVRNAAPSKLKEIAANKKTLKIWYDEQIKQIPEKCENCGGKITIPIGLSKRTPIAHIVPKASIKSVQTHDLNRWFACWQCHSNFDGWPSEKVAKMPVIKICKARFKIFVSMITDKERRYIQVYLND